MGGKGQKNPPASGVGAGGFPGFLLYFLHLLCMLHYHASFFSMVFMQKADFAKIGIILENRGAKGPF